MKKPTMQKLTSLALVLVMLLTLFPAVFAGDEGVTPCEHVYEDGVCSLCGAKEPAQACEHDFVDGVCSLCGAAEPEPTEEPDAAIPGGTLMRALAVVGPTVQTHTFVFYADGAKVHEVILKGTETLNRPANPEKSGYRFSGWYEDEALTTAFTAFDQTPTMDDGTTNVYAKFEKICYLRYLDENNEIVRTDEVVEGGSYTFRADDPAFTTELGKVNVGWIEERGQSSVEHAGDTITVTADMTLRPHLQDGHTARFLTQGGSFVASQYVLSGETVRRPTADPTHMGYDFDDWYTSADGSTKYSFGNELSDDVDIYAHWTPAQVDYLVVYWREDANCPFGQETYSVAETAIKRGYTGSLAAYDGKNYLYHHLNTEKTNTDVVINGDGSSVKNVYYDRDAYNILFMSGTTVLHDAGTCKYGQIVDWLGIDAISSAQADGKHWWYVDGIREAYLIEGEEEVPSMPYSRNGGTVHYTLSNMNGDLHVFHMFGENIEGGTFFTLRQSWCRAAGRLYLNTSDTAYFGFHLASVYPSSSIVHGWHRYDYGDWPTAEQQETMFANSDLPRTLEEIKSDFMDIGTPYYIAFWFDRNKSDIIFETEGGPAVELADPALSCEDIPYEKDISAYDPANYVKKGSAGSTRKIADGVEYEFTGWYTDETLVTEFSFTAAKMPGGDLVLYAGWTPLTSTVNFDANGGTLNSPAMVTVVTGQPVAHPTDPSHSGSSGDHWSFLGWTLNGKIYDFSSPVAGDMTLVAQWANSIQYTVVYNAGEGSGSASDSGRYLAGSTAVAASDAALTPPSGQHFVYWTDKAGNRYTRGNLLGVSASLANSDGEIVLTAQYAPDETPASLIYDLNYSHYGKASPCGYEEDADTEANRLNNTKITLRALTDAEKLPGYTFGGWFMNENCTGDAVTEVLIDHDAPTPNTVYAKWTANTDTPYTVEFYYEVDGQYMTTADESDSRTGTTDTETMVTESDKTPTREKYALDERHSDAFSGTIAGDGSLVLKVYFRRQYTITFDPNGGKLKGSTDPVSSEQYYGDEIEIIKAPTREFYKFQYWKGSEYQPGDSYMVTEDHTFVAQWAEETTSITVQKVWDDGADLDRKRSGVEATVTLKMTVDGETTDVETVKVGTANDWSKTWKELPVQKDGKAITYSVVETMAKDNGYSSDTTKPAEVENGGVKKITNRHTPTTTLKSPITGDESRLPLWQGLAALSLLGLGALSLDRKAPRRKKGKHCA